MKVTFAAAIESISGSMKTVHGKRVVFKKMQGDKPGTGHMYLYGVNDYKRTSKPSAKEIEINNLFKARSMFVSNLMKENPTLTKNQAWEIAKKEIVSVNR